ncbi:MAG: SUMF1/EgtB/PvdO family nonheme iron enzyme [Planctomycetaceae bacterium]|nr:SUMF1/EgtB/PvdO family nonheme iron enzyme [Planctomycetaceae bacterium]
MSREILAQRLQAAVDAWLVQTHAESFWTNWRGLGDGSTPDEGCVALVAYCRAVECVPDAALSMQLGRLTISPADHRRAAEAYFPEDEGRRYSKPEWDRLERRRDQLADLVQGLTATVQAAIAWVGNDPSTACEQIARAAAHYDRAWQLTSLTVPVPKSLGDDPFRSRRSLQLLYRALNPKFSPQGISISTWLILERLLATLFQERFPEPDFANEVRLLFFARHRVTFQGRVEPFFVERIPSPQMGLLLDPLAFGVTVLDAAMQRSLRLAFRCCRQSLLTQSGRAEVTFALRLSGSLPRLTSTLEGGSAGGLLAVGLLATARQIRLDRRRTATAALELKSNTTDDDLLEFAAGDVSLAHVQNITDKLRAVADPDSGIDVVALCPADHESWLENRGDPGQRPRTIGAQTLEQLLEALRGDERFDENLQQHSDGALRQWQRMESANAQSEQSIRDENETHRFDCYVPPSYRIEGPPRLRAEDRGHSEKLEEVRDDAPVPSAGDQALLALLGLLYESSVWDEAPNWLREAQSAGPRYLVVYDNAGSGKTVFSHRLQTVAAGAEAQRLYFNDRAPLVVRWEGRWPRDQHGYLPVAKGLGDQLARDLNWDLADEETARRVQGCVRYALLERRVVIILDGFDQFRPEDVAHVSALLKRGSTGDVDAARCRWIITSRVHTVDELRAELFDDHRFARVRIDPFTPEQQDEYFARRRLRRTQAPIGERWREVVGVKPEHDADAVRALRERFDELLRLPMTLWMIGELIDLTPPDQSLPRLHTLSELAHTVSQRLLQRAREKSRGAIEARLQGEGVPAIQLDEAGQLKLLERALSLIAFQLMLEREYNGRVEGSELLKFEERCRDRWFYELDAAEAERNLTERQKRDLAKKSATADDHWRWALAVLKTIELNHRSVTEAYQPTRLAFRSRKMVEFHAAWYLSEFATTWDRLGNNLPDDPDDLCAWSFSGDPDWDACWKLAIEMPREPQSEAVWAQSLAVLFRPTKRHPAGHATDRPLQLRPTELMFRTWQVLQREQSPHLLGILSDYRREFSLILATGDIEQARLAAQLVPDFEVLKRVVDPQRRAALLPPPDQPAYVCCPPKGDRLTFWMGTAAEAEHKYEDEQPRHQVEVRAFWLAACTVTRAQYRLFDPHLERVHTDEFARTAPEDDCPVIETNWFDGFCLALWLGEEASLPTETEWEGAARGGRDAPGDVIGIPPYDGSFTSDQVNYDGNYPLSGNQKSRYLARTLPVRWDLARQSAASDALREMPPYQPNAYGVWQAHGNVWEWCLSEWNEALYQQRTAAINRVAVDDIPSSSVSAARVLRGGSWGGDADYCRSANRTDDEPDGRYDDFGLRLLWRPRLVLPESSSSS